MLSWSRVDVLANTKGFFFLMKKDSTAILQPLDPYQLHRQAGMRLEEYCVTAVAPARGASPVADVGLRQPEVIARARAPSFRVAHLVVHDVPDRDLRAQEAAERLVEGDQLDPRVIA